MFRRFLFDGASIEIGVIPIQRSLSAWYFRNFVLGRLSNMKLIKAGETTAARRYVFFQLVGTDGITAVTTGEAGNRPSVSLDGAAWVSTASEIGTLVHIGNGRYYAELTSSVLVAGRNIETRYKSANTAECPGDSVQVVAYDAMDAVRLGLTALPNAAAEASGGLATLSANQSSGGTIPANMVAISGDVTAADNLEAAADGGVYNLGGGGIVASSVTNNVGGNVTGNVVGNVQGSVNSVTTGVSLAASAIGTGTFASGAINAAALALDAAQEIADAVWDEPMGAHTINDTYGNSVLRSHDNSNAYLKTTGSGAGHIGADVHEMQDNVVTGAALADSAGQDIADQILGRNIAGGSSAGRLVKDSLRFLRNRFTLVGDVLTVYAEDDTTIAWTAVVSTDEAALPITGSNPAGGAA